jgi:hypothetical protein
MIMTLTGIAFGLCFFIVPMWAYRQGLRDGLAIQNGAKTIEPIPTPIEYVEKRKEAKEVKAQEAELADGLANLFAYDGKPQQGGE